MQSQKGGNSMKKKIAVGVFLALVLATAGCSLAGAVESYRFDMDPANGVDMMEGMGAAMIIVLGALVILCECELFCTLYYFLFKPRTTAKTVLSLLSTLTLAAVVFSGPIADVLCAHVSEVFAEESLVTLALLFLYATLRVTYAGVAIFAKGECNGLPESDTSEARG